MGQWSKGKVLPENINGNQEFTTNDNLALDELNAMVNNSFYASDVADNAMKKSQEALDAVILGEGTKVTLGGVSQATWSADFAESEREKSKNLFNINKLVLNSDDNTSTVNYATGTITVHRYYNETISKLKEFADLEVGKTYTLRLKASPDITKQIYLIDTGFLWVSGGYRTITEADLNSRVVVYGAYGMDGTETLLSECQIEEGSVATDYVPYYGEISRKGDKEIEFAKSEYEKSKNLCYLYRINLSNFVGLSIIMDEEHQIATFSGTNNGDYAEGHIGLNKPFTLPANTPVTTSIKILNGDAVPNGSALLLYNTATGLYQNVIAFFLDGKPRVYKYPTDVTYNAVRILIPNDNANYNLSFNLQAEFGEIETDWQFPYGAIVHEEEIADVEHVETIYDMNDTNKNIINGVAYTNGLVINSNSFAIDFTKYKRVYVISSNRQIPIVSVVDLTVKTNDTFYHASGGISYNPQVGEYNQYYIFSGVHINITKTHITFTKSGYNSTLENGQHSVVKIIGVY